jgi:bifunctional DNA-binding transcriptional regulator/antitoxin component of YhaV-PrlF toxin-antitoxin module
VVKSALGKGLVTLPKEWREELGIKKGNFLPLKIVTPKELLVEIVSRKKSKQRRY